MNEWADGESNRPMQAHGGLGPATTMPAVRALGGELAALTAALLGMSLRPLLGGGDDLSGTAAVPVMLVHGLFGDRTNFLPLRRALRCRGIDRFATFSYLPRIDYQRLAPRLLERIDAVCRDTGTDALDVVGHSLGGLVARYLIATGRGERIRRLVTLGSPYYAGPLPTQELAIYGRYDALVPPPDHGSARRPRIVVIPDSGHLALLTHPAALEATGRFLAQPAPTLRAVGRAAA